MELLYLDEQIAVCLKPVGLSSEDGPASVPRLLAEQLGGPVFPVHRLDLNVGGVMVYARTREAAAALSHAVQHRQMMKEYLAVVHGAPEPESGVLEDLLWKDRQKNKVYVVKRQRKGVKAAQLTYRILARNQDQALVHIRLHTGRSHQIRVQFASRGWPLVGDHKYGSRDSASAPALWSYRITLPHPVTGEAMTFQRPADFSPFTAFQLPPSGMANP